MANGLFHAKPSAQRYGQTKSKASLFDDDDPEVSGSKPRQLGVVSSRRVKKSEEPGPEHHAAAAKLVKRNNRLGGRFTEPTSIQDPKLRQAYESQLLDENNQFEQDIKDGKVTKNNQKIIGLGDVGRGAKRTVTGAATAGQKAGGVGGGAVNNGAGFLLGILAYGLGAAYLQGGTTEARQWLAAKFLNHPGNASKTTAAQGTPATPAAPDGLTSTYASQVPNPYGNLPGGGGTT